MVQLSPSVATPKMAKSKTPKKTSAVATPAKPDVKTPKQRKDTPKQGKNTPGKTALQTPKMKKEVLVKDEESTPKISALLTPKTHKIGKEALINKTKNTLKAAPQTPKNITASAKKNKKAKTPKLEKPVQDFEMESEGEEEAVAPQPSLRKDVNTSEDAEMSLEEEKIEVESKSVKRNKSKKAAGKRMLEDSNQSGESDQKRQKITHDNELFIARLNVSTSKDTVKEHFSQFGEVVHVGLPRKLDKQSNKGFAFVSFKEASSMKKAFASTNQEIDSAKVVIEFKKSQKKVPKEAFPKPSHPNEVYIGGLDNFTQKRTLEEHFSKYGKVGNVTLPWNVKANRNKGYGFVSFESATSLQSALEEGHEIDGKKVDVHPAGKKSGENSVVSMKAETKKGKAALAAATVEEEDDEDEEMEGEEAESEESESDGEAEGEDEEEDGGVHDEDDDGSEEEDDESDDEEDE